MTSSPHGLYIPGDPRDTMVGTEGSETASRSLALIADLSSECVLQVDSRKLESLVNAGQHAAVNIFPGLVHTARHTMGADSTRSR